MKRNKILNVLIVLIKGLPPPVLVFVQSKERAQELFNELIYDGINVDVIHSDRTQLQVSLWVISYVLFTIPSYNLLDDKC